MTSPDSDLHPELRELIHAAHGAVALRAGERRTAELVAAALRAHLPSPAVLSAEQRIGDPDRYCSHVLHVEADGSFSIVGLVWRPGQITPIHNHVTWCVFGVIQGVEHEELFDEDLRPVGEADSHTGDVSGFAPPGDIHRVHNVGGDTAISLHIYGTDVSRTGSSVRRIYAPSAGRTTPTAR